MLFQFFYFQIPEGHVVAMVLEKQITLFGQAKAFVILVLGACHQGPVNRPAALILQYFLAIQEMLNGTVWIDHETAHIPFANFLTGVGRLLGRDQIIQRRQGTVAYHTHFGIGVFGVVQHLVFQAEA